ncbi:MAG: hypothetical protein GY861_01410 [bacterium]|nr:hypothetical protein [bacterium]
MCDYNLDEWKIVPIDDEEYCAKVSVRVNYEGDEIVYDDIRIEKYDAGFLVRMGGSRIEGKYKHWMLEPEFERIAFGYMVFEERIEEDVKEEIHWRIENGELEL